MIAFLVRLVALTWRIQVTDLCGVMGKEAPPPLIWALWHNRLLIVPVLHERYFRHRKGTALISRSKDGRLLEKCIARFGGETVRGSSSRGGSAALSELRQKMAAGYDAYITPDGPRGPRYSMADGVLWLAQLANAAIMPVSVEYSGCWRLGRWDGFVIPKPFSTVRITLRPFFEVLETRGPQEFAQERERFLATMMAATDML